MGGNNSRFLAWIIGNAIIAPAAVPLGLIVMASLTFGWRVAVPFSIGVLIGSAALLAFLYLRLR